VVAQRTNEFGIRMALGAQPGYVLLLVLRSTAVTVGCGLTMVDDDRLPLAPGEKPMMKKVRFRTLGCYPLTGAIESEAGRLTVSAKNGQHDRRQISSCTDRSPNPRSKALYVSRRRALLIGLRYTKAPANSTANYSRFFGQSLRA
jgi:hypothetical protein